MATAAVILTQIDDAISANLLAGGATEVWIDDRKVKYSLDELRKLRSEFARLANTASIGSSFQSAAMTFGDTR